MLWLAIPFSQENVFLEVEKGKKKGRSRHTFGEVAR